jgi:hypothetical protein
VIGRLFVAIVPIAEVSVAMAARADDIIVVTRGPDAVVFGSCAPSLIAHNRSRAAVDYVQVDLDFSLRDGRTHRHAFKSSYRLGVARPIPAGDTRALVIHGDESRPMGAACGDIVGVGVVDAICETDGKPCPTPISVEAGR